MTDKPKPPEEIPDFENSDYSSLKNVGDGRVVILVEDDPATNAMLKAILNNANFNVIEAVHGKDAWYKLKPELKPTLFICDILMPEMDGFKLFKQLKQNPETENIPILMISSRKAMEDTFMTLGADAFMAKPINTKEFVEMVNQLSARGAKIIEEGASSEEKPKEE